LSDAPNNRWVCRAIVYRDQLSKGFVGYGDTSGARIGIAYCGNAGGKSCPSKSLRIGICSVEELGGLPEPRNCCGPANVQKESEKNTNGSNNGQPRLRDKLCLLICQHNLNPTHVKAYAAYFCGTETLSGASRNLVESFISHLAAAAKENRDGLICKSNSSGQAQEVKP